MQQNNKALALDPFNFEEVNREAWLAKATKDLKGGSVEDLSWHAPEGFVVSPFHTVEQEPEQDWVAATRNRTLQEDGQLLGYRQWQNRGHIKVEQEKTANVVALDALNRGAEALDLQVEGLKNARLEVLLNEVLLEYCPVTFTTCHSTLPLAKGLIALAQQQDVPAEKLQGSLNYDPLAYHLTRGNPLDVPLNMLEALFDTTRPYPNFRPLTVRSAPFAEAGANRVQELAYSLSALVLYLDRLTDMGLDPAQIIERTEYSFALGGHYFMDIAKLRAWPLLVAQVAKAYGVQNFDPAKLFLHGHTALWNKTLYDPHNNLLRNTTEAMAGILGGVQALTVMPFDQLSKAPTDLSRRMARNVSTILKEESHFNKVADPVAGSWYVEHLTAQLTQQAWQLFEATEAQGGVLPLFEQGKLQEAIANNLAQTQTEVDHRTHSIVGVNQYANEQEIIDPESLPAPAKPKKQSTVPLLTCARPAQSFEQLRLQLEKHLKRLGAKQRPAIYVVLLSKGATSRARAAFATALFRTGGFALAGEYASDDVQLLLDHACNAPAALVVLCGTDDDYATMAVDFTRAFKKADAKKRPLLVAGQPTHIIAQLQEAGVDGFVHKHVDALALLTHFLAKGGLLDTAPNSHK